MKPKRVLIASFVLIIVGLFFMLNFEANITGAVTGAPSTALSPESSILFGFFLIWIAGIMLIGTIDEKVTTDVLKKREKQIMDWAINQSTEFTTAHSEAIKETGKELSELTPEEKEDVAFKIYEKVGDKYTKGFLGLKATTYFGESKLKEQYIKDARVSDEDLKNLSKNLDLTSLSQSYQKGTMNVSQGLNIYSDVEKNIGSLSKELGELLGIKKEKVKTGDVSALYELLKGKEKDKKSKEERDKILAKYK